MFPIRNGKKRAGAIGAEKLSLSLKSHFWVRKIFIIIAYIFYTARWYLHILRCPFQRLVNIPHGHADRGFYGASFLWFWNTVWKTRNLGDRAQLRLEPRSKLEWRRNPFLWYFSLTVVRFVWWWERLWVCLKIIRKDNGY